MFYLLSAWLTVFAAPGDIAQHIYASVSDSVYTIEVHTGNEDAKSVLGSGYLVSSAGHIVTNHHVVAPFIEDPTRYFIRVKNHREQRPAKLVHFDLANDLALLKIDATDAKPLPLASGKPPPVGSPIVAMGNPRGLRMSPIEGIFNGFADKGVMERMLLSMPLNEGMSGGPILNSHGEVIGTNVSIIWLSNDLSFGIPAKNVPPLLARPALQETRAAYAAETHKQLMELQENTFADLMKDAANIAQREPVVVGEATFRPLSKMFDCWDNSKFYDDQGIQYASYSCNLQFTPSIGDIGEVGSVEIYVANLSSARSSYGFYGYLSKNGSAQHIFSARRGDLRGQTKPKCTTDRVRTGNMHWKVNTCLRAYTEHDGIFDFGMAATSLNRSTSAIDVSLEMKGFGVKAFVQVAQTFLESIHFSE